MKKYIQIIIILLLTLGIADTSYLVYEHYSGVIPPCSISGFFSDCGKVLRSEYSVIFGISLSVFGLLYYCFLLLSYLGFVLKKHKPLLQLSFFISSFGAFFSTYLMYLQFIIIRSLCVYCTFSAIISISVFVILTIKYKKKFQLFVLEIFGLIYKYVVRRILFLFDSEFIHVVLVRCGEIIGMVMKIVPFRSLKTKHQYAGIRFPTRVGLAAGFDYEARLPMVTPFIGYGFHTVGTITNLSYEGNPKPRLGRLVKSKSLLVNKGFKNLGAEETIKRMKKQQYRIPVGISIGKSNVPSVNTQKKAVRDIVQCFMKFEKASLPISYYELNISCPNLVGNVSFYSKENLHQLLIALTMLKIHKPVFVKMPISISNNKFIEICETIKDFRFIKGLIIGNLQKDRNNDELQKKEIIKWKTGNFSGKPTFERSNELIALTRKKYRSRYIIIGCGGIFTVDDANKKINSGADLIQMITGMIFEGPFRVKEISLELN